MARYLVGPQGLKTPDSTAIDLLELAPEYVGLEAGPVSDADLHALRGALEWIRVHALQRGPGLRKRRATAAPSATAQALAGQFAADAVSATG